MPRHSQHEMHSETRRLWYLAATFLLHSLYKPITVEAFSSHALRSGRKQFFACRGRTVTSMSPPLLWDADFIEDGDDHTTDTSSPMYESLRIEISRFQLEEMHRRGTLASWVHDIAYFNYETCRRWAHSKKMWQGKGDWEYWIDMCNPQLTRVPCNPEEYYTKEGTWVSWDDFLGVKEQVKMY